MYKLIRKNDGLINRSSEVKFIEFDKNGLFLKDYDKPNIVAEIKADKGMNIRFNQVKFADGTYDGPFGQTLSIPNKGKGEIWLIIGKSNMASGESKGRFSVKVE